MATNASYKPQFYVVPLDPAEADQAYPLVRTIAPEVSREEWLDYVERRCREGGLIGLFGDDGAFVTFELTHAAPGRAALLQGAENLARSLGCRGIEVRTGARGFADFGSARASGWLALGVALDSVIFTKPL